MNTSRVRERLLSMRREIDDLLVEVADANAPPPPPPRVMTLKDYAKHRGVAERTVYRWKKVGLPVERRLGITRVIVAEADAWNADEAIARHAELAASGGKTG